MGVRDFVVILVVLTISAACTSYAKPPVPEDIGTNFFLKASKSVPRIGRRTMEYENYFLKQASKSIPRIGRRTLSQSNMDEHESDWAPKDLQEPVKRTFFDKYYKENEQPVWSDIGRLYQDYPGAFPVDDSYSEGGINPKPDPYWPRIKKNEEILENQPQN